LILRDTARLMPPTFDRSLAARRKSASMKEKPTEEPTEKRTVKPPALRRRFHIHETNRMHALEGSPLATAWQRALGFFIDSVFAILLWVPLEFAWRHYVLRQEQINMRWDFHEVGNVITVVLYWAVANYFGNGQTPGKWMVRTRAVSLVSDRLGRWQSIERALGYGAGMLEGGLGFAQFFWDRNRMCAQDRLAETVVVDLRKSGQGLDSRKV
jgi:uncharacterized RDD family membrane protein YckC